MSLFTKLFPKAAVNQIVGSFWDQLTGYRPVFRTFSGGIYEAELCRACIHAFATHSSKLKPVVVGARKKELGTIFDTQPNPWMDTTKFLYKTATILENETTVFLVPLYDRLYQRMTGVYPVQPRTAEIVEKDGVAYVVFSFANGKRSAIEFSKVGIVNKFFYKSEFFGESNNALMDTIQLLETQKQGISDGIKQSATIRFIGRLSNVLKPKDLEDARKVWNKTNLGSDNNGGIALADGKYAELKQVESKPYVIDAEQVRAIQENVFNFFGCSKNILQNDFTPAQWDAYYEGKIEPFALQLSLVLTNMFFTAEQKTRGNKIQFTSNRLQYASPEAKLNVVVQLVDRGMMSRNEGRELFNMEPVDGGNDYIIRAEYVNADEKIEPQDGQEEEDA